MRHADIRALVAAAPTVLARGPVALIFAEHGIALDATLAHHLQLGFGAVVAFLPPGIPAPALDDPRLHPVRYPVMARGAVAEAVNRVAAVLPGQWIYWGYDAEFLYFPFCETRTVRDLLTFHAEERREAMLAQVIDLYPADLARAPEGVCRDHAMLDRTGYFALGRTGPDGQPLDRQLDFFGGLRWRFEEHIPADRRRIDRIALLRARPGVTLDDHGLTSDAEMNTYACSWHHNLTCAVASFRVARGLRDNPDSRAAIHRFRWRNSVRFSWHSQQLMDLGLMEPGQWF